MNCQLETTPWNQAQADWLIVGVHESASWSGLVAEIDAALEGKLGRLRESGDLTGKLAELLPLHDLSQVAAKRLLLVGLGKQDELDVPRLWKALLTAARRVSNKKNTQVAVALPSTDGRRLSLESLAQNITTALVIGCVGQDIYKADHDRYPFENIKILTDEKGAGAQAAVERGRVLGEAMNLTRELINRPAQDIYPESFAERASQVAAELGLHCEILDEHRMRDEKMGSLLAVSAGSSRPPRLVVIEYRGGGNAPALGLVGKGVTFDSGGLSLKLTESMLTMKCDMSGAATVLGAMSAIARLKLPVNVIGFMGLVENMVSGTSYKLGDVLTVRNGVTIEVLNTDAEGRLVLADVLSYAVDRGASKLIDLATLTGSCVIALGEEIAGVFSNNQDWCNAVVKSAGNSGELVWQLPMHDMFSELLKSDVADIKNVAGRWGGSITAAKFLEKFVGKTPWVHLDIAGPAFASSNKPEREGGATGCMLRTLVDVAENFAK